MEGAVLPDTAPPLLWAVLAVALGFWWLWPWVERWLARPPPPPAQPVRPAPPAPAVTTEKAPPVPSAPSSAPPQGVVGEGPSSSERTVEELGFDLLEEFGQAFGRTAALIKQALSGPPTGKAYVEASAGLHRLAEVLDRAFKAFGQPDELAKVTRLREASDSFRKCFGEHVLGGSMRELLQVAGFERRCDTADGGGGEQEPQPGDAVWVFPHAEARARLHGLTVRLCLQKLHELLRSRGAGRWLHRDNDAVVPTQEDAFFAELLDLYAAVESSPEEPRASMRERNLETSVRISIGQRRTEKGLEEPLLLHKGLAGVARALAEAQRVRARTEQPGWEWSMRGPGPDISEEIRSRVAALPLPPGFSVAHLHFSSSELPRLFGLASTKGGGGKEDAGESSDKAAEILSNEAVGFWAARQQGDFYWPAAMACGVGAALDYTVNKGFIVVLLLGFESQKPSSDPASLEKLRQRPAASAAARRKAALEAPAPKPAPAPRGQGPRLYTFKDIAKPKARG